MFHSQAPTHTHTLSLHDALPICRHAAADGGEPVGDAGQDEPHRPRAIQDHGAGAGADGGRADQRRDPDGVAGRAVLDRKSTRLNSSHRCISYAVFCLKKKKYQLFLLLATQSTSYRLSSLSYRLFSGLLFTLISSRRFCVCFSIYPCLYLCIALTCMSI